MLKTGLKRILRTGLVASVITSAFLLLPVEKAYAVASINLFTSFTPADNARQIAFPPYMDTAGTWDGSNEVTNTTGDDFTLTIQNTGGTDALDIGINVDVPPGFRLPQASFRLSVSSPTGCNTTNGATRFNNLDATQLGGAGATISFNIPANRNIPAGCTYDFTVGLTTNDTIPFATSGSNNLIYDFTYDDGGPILTQSTAQFVEVVESTLSVVKTAATPTGVDGTPVTFNVSITNTGTAGLFDLDFIDNLGLNLSGIQLDVPPPYVDPAFGQNTYLFNGYLPPTQSINLTVDSTVNVVPDDTSCSIQNAASAFDRVGTVNASGFDSIPYDLNGLLTVTHNLASSYCLLCGQGEVILRIENVGGISLTDVTFSVNLSSVLPPGSGLTYAAAPTPVTFTTISGVGSIASFAPTLSGADNNVLTWNIGTLDSPADLTPSNPVEVEVRFNIQRAAGFNEEGLADDNLANVNRSFETTASFDSVCGVNPAVITTGVEILPLRQPEPSVVKTGWNVDAAQVEGNAAAFVYGHEDDDVIWRIQINNAGLADLEDLLVEDSIAANFTFTAVCQTEGDATAAAGGSIGGTCVARGPGLSAAPPFLPPPNPGVDIAQGNNGLVYYVGKIRNSCSNAINTANIEWGCDVDGTDGGIDSTNSSILLADTIGTAGLNTDVSGADLDGGVANLLDVTVTITGTNINQDAGSRGRVTIDILNDTGGTVRDLVLTDAFPSFPNMIYVVDPTIPTNATTTPVDPGLTMTVIPAFGATYDGMIDELNWDNPAAAAAPLTNTSPIFSLTSSVPGAGAYGDNLLRHGDRVIITFDIVLVENARYDLTADLDVREELVNVDDPDNIIPGTTNQLTVEYLEACGVGPNPADIIINTPFDSDVEDLDVDIVGVDINGNDVIDPDLSFLLNIDENIGLPVRVKLSNNGGHDADNYFMVVTFGNAMRVDSPPPGGECTDITGAPTVLPRPYWSDPIGIPLADSPTIYLCDATLGGIITANTTVDLDFVVSRNIGATVDDLTFRADVVGEITLNDGTALTFPSPGTTLTTPALQDANNYSLDGVRAKVIGFGLTKALEGDCTEQLSSPGLNEQVLIGEDCKFKITSGGWFGFDTPGFGIIAVHNITVSDALPAGQGFISQTDGGPATIGGGSDTEIKNIVFGPGAPPAIGPVNPFDQGTVSWNFNPVTDKLFDRDKFFRTDIISRILNDPIDSSAAPNQHDFVSHNILNTTFDADFDSGVFSFGPATPGYPIEALRSFDLNVTEPNLIVVKEVCNETLSIAANAANAGANCNAGVFADFINNGDTQDAYVYKITITNDDPGAATTNLRAPAYNVVVRDILDASDLMQVTPIESPQVLDPLTYPFNNDGLDNDGDGLTDEGDEARILTDNNVNIPANIVPGEIEFSYVNSTALLQIDDGEVVTLYYRVDPDDFIAPLQIMTNTVSTVYDSLLGDFGSQNIPQVAAGATDGTTANVITGTGGSARVYTTAGETARVQILPLEVEPKILVQTALQTGAGPLPDLSSVVVGEEVQYRLRTLIPVANLREFTVRDELPPGMSCVDVPDVDLGASPYDAAGFVPGGVFTVANGGITCNDNLVQWNFGDQELTAALGNTRFVFEIDFISRVENTPTTNISGFIANTNNCIIRNGGALVSRGDPPIPASLTCNQDTFVRTSYRNDPSQGSLLIEHIFDPVQVTVREPQVQVTKTFFEVNSLPGTEETAGDAKDIFEVRVVVENIGDGDAYNLQVLDNLVNTKYTYIGNVGGTDIPLSDGGITLPLPGSGAPGSNQPVFSWPANFTVLPGAANTISFSYWVQSNDDVAPLEDVANTIEAKWTSLENNTFALNRTGVIAVDGDVLGMRNGYFPSTEPIPANIENDYIFNSTDSIVVPGLTVTKTDLDKVIDPLDTLSAIGDHRRFQVDIDLPEGVTTSVNIIDNLNFGDESYILESEAGLEVQYEFFGIQSINGTAPVDGTTTTFLAEPVDETPNSANWNIGLVVTQTEDDSPLNLTPLINPKIRITYFARVNNDLVTNDGDDLRNEATLQYLSGFDLLTTVTEISSTTNVTVVEPVMTVTKVADVTTADAGDVIQYTVTVEHHAASTSEAFDLNIVDTLPVNVVYNAGSSSILINGVATGIAEPTLAGQVLTWGRNNTADDTLDVPLTESLILVYSVTVQNSVQPLEIIQNSIVIDWTSLDGDITGLERIGIGGVDCSASVAPDVYCAVPVVPAVVTVVDANTIVKTKTNDSFNLTPAGTDVRIGDIIEYTLTLTLQEGTTRELTLVDTLSNGLEFVDIVSVNDETVAPYGSANGFIHAPITPPVSVPTGAGNNVLNWAIGDNVTGIINSANDGNNDFVIVYRAVVTKNEFILPQVATTPISNTVDLDYRDVNDLLTSAASLPPLSRLTSSVNLDVQQPIIFYDANPALSNVIKDRYPSAIPSGSSVSPDSDLDFRLLACNVGTAPAYDLILIDDLAPELRHDLIANMDVDLTDPTGVTQLTQLVSGTDYIYTPPAIDGGDMIFNFNNVNAPLPPNQCIRIMFDIRVDIIGVNFSWDNLFRVDIYHSLDLDDVNAVVAERQIYAPAVADPFNMNTVTPNNPPLKALDSPLNVIDPTHDEATIGELVVYQITVPSDDDDLVAAPNPNPMTAALFRVRVEDTLSSHLTFVSAELDPASPYTQVAPLITSVGVGNVLDIQLDPLSFLPVVAMATQPAIINVTARVSNVPATNNTVAEFANTANYYFTRATTDTTEIPGGAATTDIDDDVFIVEPELTLMAKTVTNLTQVNEADTNAGDILQYTLTFNTSGGAANDIYSDAFDVTIIDSLDPGLDYCSPVEDVNCINPSSTVGTMEVNRAAIISGNGSIATPHVITWKSLNGTNTDIDVVEGTALVTVTYTVKVMDSVLANNTVDSSTVVEWTSLDGAFEPDERTYTATILSAPSITVPVLNDLTKTLEPVNGSTSTLAGMNDVRIGDIVDYQLVISLQEATSSNFILSDVLSQGLIYEGIVSINGDNDGSFEPVAPFDHPVYTQAITSLAGDPAAPGGSTITWSFGDLVNTGNNITTDDDFVIVYRARVLNLVQTPLDNPASNIDLTNTVSMVYDTVLTDINNADNTYTITIDQPNLSVLKLLDPVVPDSVIESDEVITFTIDITNNGESPAYDIVIEDILPLGLRKTPPVLLDIEMPDGTTLLPLSVLPASLQLYDPLTGQVLWNLDTGTADELTLAVGQTMQLTYQVVADTDIGAGLINVTNAARALRYHSYDNDDAPLPVNAAPGIVPVVVPVREIYVSNVASTVALSTVGPGALDKTNQLDTLISIGETFVYTIKIPDVPVPTALHDIRILDDLSAIPGVDLIFVSVVAIDDDATPGDEDDNYVPINTSGDPTNLVIEDIVNGIEIPANETITIEITVQLANSPNNLGLTPLQPVADLFANTAEYTFNGVDNDVATQGAGAPDTTGNLTVVEPFLSITKMGPSVPNNLVRFNQAIPYRLVVENMGGGPAYDITITDKLPEIPDNVPPLTLTGGTCNSAPSVTSPNNFVLEVFKDDEVTSVSGVLAVGVDYTVTHTPAPVCELVFTTLTPLAKVELDEKLIITYDTYLDLDSMDTAELTNTASVTRYFSLDTPAGSVIGQIREYANDPVSVLDEAQYTVVVEAPNLAIIKKADNNTTAGSGGFADPGDELHYTIDVVNNGSLATGLFRFSDQPDQLNLAPGYFDFSSIKNILVDGLVVPFTAIGGVLEIPDLSVDELGGAKNTVSIEFDINLLPVITSGTLVLNQAVLDVTGFSLQLSDSDDPNAGAPNPPTLTDPTETLIDAAPVFLVEKRSVDITGDPNILVQGDTLRYTLEVKNIGLENVNGAYLRDLVPANTSYVAESTTLNGVAVADVVAGISPLESELLINAPENLTPGFMRAEADLAVTGNVATVTFDAVVALDVVDGTVISNQGYVGGLGVGSGPFAEQASNDPDTSINNDPTIDVVGNLPVFSASKTVSLFNDVNSDGIVDVGDTLEYNIVVSNVGALAATQVSLTDVIPANSTYVADSVFLNGSLVPVPDANLVSTSPLVVRFNSADLGVHNQAANDGQVTAGNEAVITFRVVASGAVGSLISNQATISSNELPEELTDADGNTTNGRQTTDVYIGANSQLNITKEVFVVGGDVAQAGGELEYILTVSNTGFTDASNVSLTDVIPLGVVSYQTGLTKLDGSTSYIGSSVIEPGANLTVDYQSAKGVLEAGEKLTVSYRVTTNAGLLPGEQIINTATVTWTEQTNPISDTATIEIGGAPGVGVVGGNVWHDVNRTPAGVFDSGIDISFDLWTVELYFNNFSSTLFATTVTDANGAYQFKGLSPTITAGASYELRFIPVGGDTNSPSMGPGFPDANVWHTNAGIPGEMRITDIEVDGGSNIAEEHYPVTPQGIVYDTVLRAPVTGVQLRLIQKNGSVDPALWTEAPANCFPANANQDGVQTTLNNGFYRFDIQRSSCSTVAVNPDDFEVEIIGVPTNYLSGTSRVIPPGKAGNTQLVTATCSESVEDMILGNSACDIQNSGLQPDTSVPVRTDSTRTGTQGTSYYLELNATADGDVAFNNHIPVDPDMASIISVSKVSAMVNVTRGQLVPYTITLTNTLPVPLTDLDLIDIFPPGFKYIAGSARVQRGTSGWVKIEPVYSQGATSIPVGSITAEERTSDGALTRILTWGSFGIIDPNEVIVIKLLLVVGSGVGEGEYVNRAMATNILTAGAASGMASATVRVVPDPTFDCSDVIGKVFDDKNLNAYQDENEAGLPGVRVVTAKGLEVTADKYGRFHITCAVVPNGDRGSNFIIKLDERSLPTGYRLTTENPRVVRATRGKMLKFNFGAAVHRVVRLDMADAVFEPGTTEMRPQWLPRLDLLLTELAKDPSILRLSYLADNETESEVNDRLDAVKDEIEERWETLNCCYQLMIETEVFWRKGGPQDRGTFDD